MRLLYHLNSFGLRHRVQPARAAGTGCDDGVRGQLQPMIRRNAIRPLRGCLEVNHLAIGVQHIDDAAHFDACNPPGD